MYVHELGWYHGENRPCRLRIDDRDDFLMKKTGGINDDYK